MGWSIGYDSKWKRWIGYGVPAYCDFPDCDEEINRGLSYVCGAQQPYGGENGCGLFMCELHRVYHSFRGGDKGFFCKRCTSYKHPYKAKPEHPDWVRHILTDESWAEWRAENPGEVEKLRKL